jgi:hypothetical protein
LTMAYRCKEQERERRARRRRLPYPSQGRKVTFQCEAYGCFEAAKPGEIYCCRHLERARPKLSAN